MTCAKLKSTKYEITFYIQEAFFPEDSITFCKLLNINLILNWPTACVMCKGEVTIFFYETPKSKDRVIHDSGLCFLYISAVNAKNHQMWLNSVCQHIPGVTECEQTQVESCGGMVKKLGKDLNVSHLWPPTPWCSGQIAQSLHACFPTLKKE